MSKVSPVHNQSSLYENFSRCNVDDIPKLHPPKQRPIVAPPTPSDKGEAPAIDSDDDTDEEGKGPAGGPSSKEPSVADKRRSTNGQLYLVNSTSKVHKKIKHVSCVITSL